MPELPEVTTTVRGLLSVLPGLTIQGVWSDYHLRTAHGASKSIKNKNYFARFKREVTGEKVNGVERRGKNILIHLSGGKTILVHMKMTGHFLYGSYERRGNVWKSDEPFLRDSFNQFIRLVFTLSNGRHLAFSDMRKFAKVILFETKDRETISDLSLLGPEPLENFSLADFRQRLLSRPSGKIKTVLMDQTVLAGIGNIYSDEILWQAGVHPERKASSLSTKETADMWRAMLKILETSIAMGGDSMSDYRDIRGRKGNFQNTHKAYRRAKKPCLKKGCPGTIVRTVIGGRSAHFCDTHQK